MIHSLCCVPVRCDVKWLTISSQLITSIKRLTFHICPGYEIRTITSMTRQAVHRDTLTPDHVSIKHRHRRNTHTRTTEHILSPFFIAARSHHACSAPNITSSFSKPQLPVVQQPLTREVSEPPRPLKLPKVPKPDELRPGLQLEIDGTRC